VARRYLTDDGQGAVDLDIWGESQRGQVTTPGHATILLASRERGPVQLPSVPAGATSCQAALDGLVERFGSMDGSG
jgi:hypothetical protein